MSPTRFDHLTARYPALRIAVIGDFCLDRYLEIDPARAETSIETGLPVHNITRIRSQPGAAGTILANLAALGIGTIHAIGFCGDDGEGYELHRALNALPGVDASQFFTTTERRTFTYTKPLVCAPEAVPVELSRLDVKNWTHTPSRLSRTLAEAVRYAAPEVDAIIVMDQVSEADTGAITPAVRRALAEIGADNSIKPIVADSRRSLRDFANVIWKMNAAELATLGGGDVGALAQKNGRAVFVTQAERGMIGATPDGTTYDVPAHPVRGPIDIVGAGDSVTANLTAALAAGATPREAMELAMAAASVVIHQLGTTGTARVEDLQAFAAG
jgi:rfaE bifunctional protein kinase chain/domain